VTSTNGDLGTTGVWTQTTGTLVLTAVSGGMTQGIVCEVRFVLKNTATTQTSPAVSVEARIEDGLGVRVGSIPKVAMDKPSSRNFGVLVGFRPLEVVTPSFTVKHIRQSSPVINQRNTLSVSLRPNYFMRPGSSLTLYGLTGASTPSNDNLPIQPDNSRFPTLAR
jgi:hypothetical protein